MKINARIVLVGDPDQLPSVGAGNVFREIIETKIVPVTVLDQIFRQSKDSLIAYNAKFINEGNTKLFYGPDFVFVSGDSQEDTAEKITERYCLEIQESGIENVQILSPFRSEGAASSEQLNETIRELVNPFALRRRKSSSAPRYSGSMTASCRPRTQKRSLMEIWASSGILRTLTRVKNRHGFWRWQNTGIRRR